MKTDDRKIYDYQGRKISMNEIVSITGLKRNTIATKISSFGMSVDEIIEKSKSD